MSHKHTQIHTNNLLINPYANIFTDATVWCVFTCRACLPDIAYQFYIYYCLKLIVMSRCEKLRYIVNTKYLFKLFSYYYGRTRRRWRPNEHGNNKTIQRTGSLSACKRSFYVICMNKSEQPTSLWYYYVDFVVYAYHTRIYEIHSFWILNQI